MRRAYPSLAVLECSKAVYQNRRGRLDSGMRAEWTSAAPALYLRVRWLRTPEPGLRAARTSWPAALRQTHPCGRSGLPWSVPRHWCPRVRERIRIQSPSGGRKKYRLISGLMKVHSRMSTIWPTPDENPPPAPPAATACWPRPRPSERRAASTPPRGRASPARPRSAAPRRSGNQRLHFCASAGGGDPVLRRGVSACRLRERIGRRLVALRRQKRCAAADLDVAIQQPHLPWSWPGGRRAACPLRGRRRLAGRPPQIEGEPAHARSRIHWRAARPRASSAPWSRCLAASPATRARQPAQWRRNRGLRPENGGHNAGLRGWINARSSRRPAARHNNRRGYVMRDMQVVPLCDGPFGLLCRPQPIPQEMPMSTLSR